ncbi:MAG TPA: ribonuclease P protein component [Chloroflexota bacterium]
MLSQDKRLTRKADFDRVFAAGGAAHHELISLRAAPNELARVRVGIMCGKRVGGAVVRNRARRRLREAVRSLLAKIAPGWDILLVIRPPGASATVAEFVYALEELLRRRQLAGAREE